jgi:hypothetical protein
MTNEQLKQRIREQIERLRKTRLANAKAVKTKRECEGMIEDALFPLIPLYSQAMVASSLYESSPSIANGSRKYDEITKAQKAENEAVEFLWVKYHALYSDIYTPEEMKQMINTVLEQVRCGVE